MTTSAIRTRRTPPAEFGPTLVSGRAAARISGREVARRVGIGSGYYTQLEKGTRCPSMSVALLLADALGLGAEARAVVLAGAVTDVGRDHPNRGRETRSREPKPHP